MNTASQPAAEPGRVDLAGLFDYVEDAGLDTDILHAMLQCFLDQSEDQENALTAAVSAEKFDATASAAHALKSSSATLRAVRLAGFLESMEGLARDRDPSCFAMLTATIEELRYARAVFDAELRRS